MSDGLKLISRHVNRVLAEQTRPLMLEVDDAWHLLGSRGDGRRYGLGELQAGASMEQSLAFLATADPDDKKPQAWRFVQLPGARICHVHVLRLERGWALALLDAEKDHAEQQARQQAAHELELLQEERERLIRELEQANRLFEPAGLQELEGQTEAKAHVAGALLEHRLERRNAVGHGAQGLGEESRDPSVREDEGPAGLLRGRLAGDRQRELLIIGPDATLVTDIEGAASAGEVVVSEATAGQLPPSHTGRAVGPGLLVEGHPQRGHEQRGGDPLARDICNTKSNLILAQLYHILIVATHIKMGMIKCLHPDKRIGR